jgi:predicted nucleic acid-binding protein
MPYVTCGTAPGTQPSDAIALVVAEMVDANVVWTFDRRWRDVHQRVAIP